MSITSRNVWPLHIMPWAVMIITSHDLWQMHNISWYVISNHTMVCDNHGLWYGSAVKWLSSGPWFKSSGLPSGTCHLGFAFSVRLALECRRLTWRCQSLTQCLSLQPKKKTISLLQCTSYIFVTRKVPLASRLQNKILFSSQDINTGFIAAKQNVYYTGNNHACEVQRGVGCP